MNIWEQKYEIKIASTKILWRVDLLLGGDAAYVCAVTSHNKRTSDPGRCFMYIRAEAVFSVHRGPCRGYIRETAWRNSRIPCGGGVEYLHCSPASRRRRQKGKSGIWGSKIWSRVPWDSDRKVAALARTISNCKWQTRPLVRESAPHQQNRNCLTVINICS
jgi:hypothetical protein